MPVEIRELVAADAARVADFQLRTVLTAYARIFPDDAPPPDLGELVVDWRDRWDRKWVAIDDGEIVGTVAVEDGDVRRLLVDPGRWRQSIGTALLHTALDEIRRAGHATARLWVLEDNDRGRRFYERHGWTLVDGEVLLHATGVREVRYASPTLSPP